MDNGSQWRASKDLPAQERRSLANGHSELIVKLVNVEDMTNVIQLRDQPKSAKHVAFDQSGSCLAVSCTDGIVYVYSVSSEQPQLLKALDGLIKMLEGDELASSMVHWHPDGRALAAPTATRGLSVCQMVRERER